MPHPTPDPIRAARSNLGVARDLNEEAGAYRIRKIIAPFIDSTPGTPIHAGGLFQREEAMPFLGIVHEETGPCDTTLNPPDRRRPTRQAMPDLAAA